jgi:outer membrane protein TolC
MANEYKKALDAHNAAAQAFEKVRDAYRARVIGDDEFLAARAAYTKATEAFDAAFAKAACGKE